MSDTIAPPVEPQVPPTPRSRKPFYAGVGVAAVALAAGGAALGIGCGSFEGGQLGHGWLCRLGLGLLVAAVVVA